VEQPYATLMKILTQAHLFQHYHQPTDTYEKLSEAALAMNSAAVWKPFCPYSKNNCAI
jgi:hypothetical protein